MVDLRKSAFSIIFISLLAVSTELILRLAMSFYGYSFIKPPNFLYDQIYTNIKVLTDKDVRNDDEVVDILLLGGSVISTNYMNLEGRLALLLKKYHPTRKFVIYNVAAPAHTSLDNLLKYS